MVTKQTAATVDEGIAILERSLTQLPNQVRTRVISLKANPSEVISRIQQINGLIVVFEER